MRRALQVSANLSRRDLLAGAGAGALLIEQAAGQLQAQTQPNRAIIFSHTTVVTTEGVRDDVGSCSSRTRYTSGASMAAEG